MLPRSTSCVVAVVLVLYLAHASTSLADVSCMPQDVMGNQRCVAGLRSEIAQTLYAQQSMSQWCWAASIAMVFRHHGYHVPQEQIVSEAWGGIVNMPGQPAQILQSLNRTWTDNSGKRFTVRGDVYSASPFTAAQDLADNNPLIIGTQGHAMVLTALEYLRAPNGSGSVISATVRDPWPGRGRRVLEANEWFQTMLLVRINVSPAGGGSTGGGSDTCEYANDGECDEPDTCDPGTDESDCRRTKKKTARLPRYCCTSVGRLGPYPNPGPNGIAVNEGEQCYGTHPAHGTVYGTACR